MIDGQEPKNGDFATYVENLSRAPTAHVPNAEPPGTARSAQQARAEVSRALAALREKKARKGAPDAAGGLWGRNAGMGVPTGAGLHGALEEAMKTGDATRVAQQVRAFAARVLGRIALVAFFVGIVLIGLSIVDDSLEFASPSAGVVLMIVGAVLHRAAAKLA